MLIPLILALILFFSYFILMLLYFAGLVSKNGKDSGAWHPNRGVSLVIPFRNEAMHLPAILADLKAQDYPAHLFSVVLVNDHSTDGSLELVRSITENMEQFRCLDLPGGRSGKKEALAYALSKVTSSWILQTDADCRLGPAFISSHMQHQELHSSELVAGMVSTGKAGGGFLEAFERLDLLALNGCGAGSFAVGKPLMCSGANLLYSMDLYRESRVFDPSGQVKSGDDMFLLIGARKLKKNVSFNTGKDGLVLTAPVENAATLVRQRIRWGAKSAHYGMADIQAVALLVSMVSILMLLAPLGIFLRPEISVWILGGVGLKILADFMILSAASQRTGLTKSLWWYLPAALLHPFYLAIVIVGSIRGKSSWKGRAAQESLLR